MHRTPKERYLFFSVHEASLSHSRSAHKIAREPLPRKEPLLFVHFFPGVSLGQLLPSRHTLIGPSLFLASLFKALL